MEFCLKGAKLASRKSGSTGGPVTGLRAEFDWRTVFLLVFLLWGGREQKTTTRMVEKRLELEVIGSQYM